MPDKTGKNFPYSKEQFAQEQKRSLIDSLEALRGGNAREVRSGAAPCAQPVPIPAVFESLQVELKSLREELATSKTTNAILEKDILRIEQRALDAIAENGQLKQRIDKMQQNSNYNADADEQAQLLADLRQSRNDHFMLTQALIDSENEISRLTLTLEKVTGKLFAA